MRVADGFGRLRLGASLGSTRQHSTRQKQVCLPPRSKPAKAATEPPICPLSKSGAARTCPSTSTSTPTPPGSSITAVTCVSQTVQEERVGWRAAANLRATAAAAAADRPRQSLRAESRLHSPPARSVRTPLRGSASLRAKTGPASPKQQHTAAALTTCSVRTSLSGSAGRSGDTRPARSASTTCAVGSRGGGPQRLDQQLRTQAGEGGTRQSLHRLLRMCDMHRQPLPGAICRTWAGWKLPQVSCGAHAARTSSHLLGAARQQLLPTPHWRA